MGPHPPGLLWSRLLEAGTVDHHDEIGEFQELSLWHQMAFKWKQKAKRKEDLLWEKL